MSNFNPQPGKSTLEVGGSTTPNDPKVVDFSARGIKLENRLDNLSCILLSNRMIPHMTILLCLGCILVASDFCPSSSLKTSPPVYLRDYSSRQRRQSNTVPFRVLLRHSHELILDATFQIGTLIIVIMIILYFLFLSPTE